MRGGIVLLDLDSGQVKRVIALQCNPDTLRCTLEPQTIGGDGRERRQALRFSGPSIETIKVEIEIDTRAARVVLTISAPPSDEELL